MAETVLGGTISFLTELGVYDVILPFLFVFTIVFAILEKTRIFGTDVVEGNKTTRKNLNAMAAFVMGFFVVASSKLVTLIHAVAGQAFLLILLLVLFLMLAGLMMKDGEYQMPETWRKGFMSVGIVVLVLIFFNALGWIETAYDFLSKYWDTEAVSAIILLVLIGIFVAVMTGDKKPTTKKENKGD
jgi:succinate dehydrogenase hydrophobic anchor subunit